MDERRDWGAIGAGFLVFLLALYMIWQFGRAFGRGELRRDLVAVYQQSFPTYFFREDQTVSVASDAGLIRPVVVRDQANMGRCFTGAGDWVLVDLLR